MQSQRCDDVCDIALTEINANKWSHRSIDSALTLTPGVNGPLKNLCLKVYKLTTIYLKHINKARRFA